MNAAGEALIPILKKNDMYSHKIYYDHKNTDQYFEGKGFWFHVNGALKTVYMPFYIDGLCGLLGQRETWSSI